MAAAGRGARPLVPAPSPATPGPPPPPPRQVPPGWEAERGRRSGRASPCGGGRPPVVPAPAVGAAGWFRRGGRGRGAERGRGLPAVGGRRRCTPGAGRAGWRGPFPSVAACALLSWGRGRSGRAIGSEEPRQRRVAPPRALPAAGLPALHRRRDGPLLFALQLRVSTGSPGLPSPGPQPPGSHLSPAFCLPLPG